MLRRAIAEQRRPLTLGSGLVAVHQGLEAAVPVAIGLVVDRAVATGDAAAMVRWGVAVVALFAVLSASGCVALWLEERAVAHAVHGVRTRVAERVLAPGGGVDDTRPGELVSLSSVEAARIGEGVGAVILGAGAVAGTLVGATVLLVTSLPAGLAVVVGVPVVMLGVQALSAPLIVRADAHQAAVGSAAGIAADLLGGLRVLKGLGAARTGADSYRSASAGALRAALGANRVRSTYTGITFTVAAFFLVVVAWIGGHQALEGDITVGELIALLGLTQFLLGPLGRLALTNEVIAQARASSERIGAALAAPAAVADGPGALPAGGPGRLTLSDVRHGPLAGLTLDVAPGELVGVVAAAPADAVALVAVLGRTVDPAGGTVAVDGVALDAVPVDEARRAVVVAHHDAPLFEDALVDEVASAAPVGTPAHAGGDGAAVAAGAESASGAEGASGAGGDGAAGDDGGGRVPAGPDPADPASAVPAGVSAGVSAVPAGVSAGVPAGVDAAIEAAGASDVALALAGAARDEAAAGGAGVPVGGEADPGAVDAVATTVGRVLGESGRGLSGGQRQRVALARALATDARVLVLHDPTTAVDAATEHGIAHGLRSRRQGRTTVVVTSSPTLLAAADRVVLVVDGRAAAAGTHAELATDDRYREVVLT